MNRSYEIAIILHPDVDAQPADILSKIEEWITRDGGTIVRTEHAGKRKLAYPINKQQEGFYALWYAELSPSALIEIERSLRLTEQVMRFLFVRLEAIPAIKEVTPVVEESQPVEEVPSPEVSVSVDVPEVTVDALPEILVDTDTAA